MLEERETNAEGRDKPSPQVVLGDFVGWPVQVVLQGTARNPDLASNADAAELMAAHQLVDGVAPDVQQLRDLGNREREGEVMQGNHPPSQVRDGWQYHRNH